MKLVSMVIMKPYLTASIKMMGDNTLISYKCQLLQGKPHICARLLAAAPGTCYQRASIKKVLGANFQIPRIKSLTSGREKFHHYPEEQLQLSTA